MGMRTITAALAAMLLGSSAHAAFSVSTNSDVAAGQAAFGAASDAFNLRNLFAPGSSWTLGVWGGPAVSGTTLTDPVTGGILSTTSLALDARNWIDGPGFDNGSAAAPDLAVSGFEDVRLTMAGSTNRLGFAVSVDTGLLSTEYDIVNGSVIFLYYLYSDNDIIGTDFLTLPNPSGGGTYWVDVQSTVAFNGFRMSEIPVGISSETLKDQYFSNFVTGSLPATGGVPEPASWALLIAGFGLVGAAQRRRRLVLS